MGLASKSRFCILPWVQLCSSTDGTVLSCCRSRGTRDLGSLNDKTISEIWSSDNYKKLREQILNNEVVFDCTDCYNLEELGIKSVRETANEEYKHLFKQVTSKNPKIKSIELRLSNICNFKCKTCGPRFSSSWIPFTENPSAHKITSTYGERGEDFWKEFQEIIPEIESFYFAGGEPLIHKDHYRILELLISQNNLDCQLNYNTNFSTYKFNHHNILDLWKNFKNVKLNISLDGSHEKGEYIRTGLDWQVIKQNLEVLKTSLPAIQIEISFTLSVLNVFHAADFFLELINDKIIVSLDQLQVNFLEKPEFYSVGILDSNEKNLLQNFYEKKISLASDLISKDELVRYSSKLKQILDYTRACEKPFERKKFTAVVRQVDKLMGGKFIKTFPELSSIYLEGLNNLLID